MILYRMMDYRTKMAGWIRRHYLRGDLNMKLMITGGAGFIGSNFVHFVYQHRSEERRVGKECRL